MIGIDLMGSNMAAAVRQSTVPLPGSNSPVYFSTILVQLVGSPLLFSLYSSLFLLVPERDMDSSFNLVAFPNSISINHFRLVKLLMIS